MLAIAVPAEYQATTILLDLNPLVAMARKTEQGGDSKFDNMGSEFFTAHREIFSSWR
ncbi:hypothetical protein PV379_01265 [Streptomyces caniscabiei]|uniref:hypothetical protein n=1 Tax=Streptomyces caniscabiei TaxID=2746961 RepID=UPI0029BA6113|nr:hypothetical protein [Streptomyces caniscabiei]MDX2775983.1 hypothetical protein [Streptomyces caniscabiei]